MAVQHKHERIVFIIKIVRLIFNILILGHLFCILWLAIGQVEQSHGIRNWIDKYDSNTVREDWTTRYVYALYWAITTMTTVGYVILRKSENYTRGK